MIDNWGNDLTDPAIQQKVATGPLISPSLVADAVSDGLRTYGVTASGIVRVFTERDDVAFYFVGAQTLPITKESN